MNQKLAQAFSIIFLAAQAAISLIMLYCSIRCEDGLNLLRNNIGDYSKFEWYSVPAAREMFHVQLRFESEFIYWWPVQYAAAVLFLTISFIIQYKFLGLTTIKVFLHAGSLAILLVLLLNYWKTWQIVSVIVD